MATSSPIYEDLDGDVENSSDSDQMSGDLDCNSDDDVEQLLDDREDDWLAEGDGNNYKNQQEVQKEQALNAKIVTFSAIMDWLALTHDPD